MIRTHRTTALVALATALSLAACSSSKDVPKGPLNESGTAVTNESDNATNVADSAPAFDPDHPTVSANQAASEPVGDPNALPPGDAPPPSAQIRDDADASGLTARLPDPNAPQPAEQGAQQR